MLYFTFFIIGLFFLFLSFSYFVRRTDLVGEVTDRYNLYFTTKDITLSAPLGVSFAVTVGKTDRQAAWKIYTQLKTRVAAVDFNEDYDSLYLTHQSLNKIFDLVRNEIGSIPIERIQKDKSDQMVNFYTSILNDGIRPHLSKWHLPVSQWVESQKALHPSLSFVELEKTFPQRKEALESVKLMNKRMATYADQLLAIVKAR